MTEKQLNAIFNSAHEAAQTLVNLFGDDLSYCSADGDRSFTIQVGGETAKRLAIQLEQCGATSISSSKATDGDEPVWTRYVFTRVASATCKTNFYLQWQDPRLEDEEEEAA